MAEREGKEGAYETTTRARGVSRCSCVHVLTGTRPLGIHEPVLSNLVTQGGEIR